MYALEIAWIFFNVFMNLISFVFVVLVDLLYVRVNFGVTSDGANINILFALIPRPRGSQGEYK